jgi:hypothetical protein
MVKVFLIANVEFIEEEEDGKGYEAGDCGSPDGTSVYAEDEIYSQEGLGVRDHGEGLVVQYYTVSSIVV